MQLNSELPRDRPEGPLDGAHARKPPGIQDTGRSTRSTSPSPSTTTPGVHPRRGGYPRVRVIHCQEELTTRRPRGRPLLGGERRGSLCVALHPGYLGGALPAGTARCRGGWSPCLPREGEGVGRIVPQPARPAFPRRWRPGCAASRRSAATAGFPTRRASYDPQAPAGEVARARPRRLGLPLLHYKMFKDAAGKTLEVDPGLPATRAWSLSPYPRCELVSRDEMELDRLGDAEGRRAVFAVMSDTSSLYSFLFSIMLWQTMSILCKRALVEYGGSLPVPVTLLMDEFANIGRLPDVERMVAVVRSRNISMAFGLQSLSQLKAAYKDNARRSSTAATPCCSSAGSRTRRRRRSPSRWERRPCRPSRGTRAAASPPRRPELEHPRARPRAALRRWRGCPRRGDRPHRGGEPAEGSQVRHRGPPEVARSVSGHPGRRTACPSTTRNTWKGDA